MSKQMKLIMETFMSRMIDDFEAERTRATTAGELKKLLKSATRSKKTGEALNKVFGASLGAIAGPIKDAFEIALGIYRLPDSTRTNTALDYLNVDDDISAVLDDRVENQFLNDTLEWLSTMNDDDPIDDITIEERLKNYIKQKYNQTKVEKDL